jgi:hypothetical protein
MSRVGSARVEITGDDSQLASEVECELNKALQSMNIDPRAFQPISDAAESAASDV